MTAFPVRALSAVSVAILAGLLAACGAAGSDPAAKPPAAITPSNADRSQQFKAEYANIAEYLNRNLPPDHPWRGLVNDNNATLDDALAAVCRRVDGKNPPAKLRRSFARSVAKGGGPVPALTLHQGEVLFDAIAAGCRATGHAADVKVFAAADYKYPSLLTALHKAGFDEFIFDSKDPDAAASSCEAISDEKPGGAATLSTRRRWMKMLTGSDDSDYGWSRDRATKFVDTLFAACFSTGLAEPYVPPPTTGQSNALAKAREYLKVKPYSRQGLINQLSSEYGEGFSVADSTWAVSHLDVDWNRQALLSAKQYLKVMHPSLSALTNELESSYGEGFTHDQAAYGATKAYNEK